MTMKRIFFFDIDNTLLDHRTHTIPNSATAAIARLHQAGHMVVVATGRSYGHAEPVVEPFDPDYVITQNGARIHRHHAEVYSRTLDPAALDRLFDRMATQGHPYGANQGVIGYINEAVPATTIALDSVNLPWQTNDPFYRREAVHQAWLFFDEALDSSYWPVLIADFPEFDFVRWNKTGVDVMPAGVNKWTGCQWVLEQTGFRAEDAIAFGDGLNDMQMLQGVGLGIAMDNGHPELKAIADHIAPALHLDGIATMLGQLAKSGHP